MFKKELKKLKNENEKLRNESFAIDLKNSLNDYFNKDHNWFSSFIGIKIIGSLAITSVERQSFYDFCSMNRNKNEFK